MNHKYPIYIVSKGRWESRLTSKALEQADVPYRIVIEPQEFDNYARYIEERKILVLPFSNLGQGSIPARNWIWEHALQEGYARHWILDDNIRGFYRLNRNRKIRLRGTAVDRAFFYCEHFTERYTNIALSGMQYEFFAPRKKTKYPFIPNTRVYSCILIDNALPIRWRGRYNEDTDLSLRVLKAGWCTILFQAFLCKKTATMRMKGGNTDELYQGDGRLKMAQALVEQHPDVAHITWKWGRWQHHVDYRPFRFNRLQRREASVSVETVC